MCILAITCAPNGVQVMIVDRIPVSFKHLQQLMLDGVLGGVVAAGAVENAAQPSSVNEIVTRPI